VVFLVYPAAQPPFNDLPGVEQGIIGLPVLLACGHIRWDAGRFSIIADVEPTQHGKPNLVLDGADLIAEGTFQSQAISLFVDSGSEWSLMYPRFTKRYSGYVRSHGTKTTKKLEGFGGMTEANAWRVRELPITIGSGTAILRQVDSLIDYTDQHSRDYDGCLGLDTMIGSHSVEIDFGDMHISIQ
jgi:hypothetical protein